MPVFDAFQKVGRNPATVYILWDSRVPPQVYPRSKRGPLDASAPTWTTQAGAQSQEVLHEYAHKSGPTKGRQV